MPLGHEQGGSPVKFHALWALSMAVSSEISCPMGIVGVGLPPFLTTVAVWGGIISNHQPSQTNVCKYAYSP
jgi:hypothetical protein